MYLDATLALDPSKSTEHRHVEPDRAFGRLLHLLTGGRTGPVEEVETFGAVAILQQLDMAARGLGITDVVRLARDGRDFYLDTRGRDDDLADALDALQEDPSASEASFDALKLVLRHVDAELTYLVEIDVARAHAPGQAPITIGISAVMTELGGHTRDEVSAKLAPIFDDQRSYDAYLATKQAHFDAFLVRFAAAVTASIPADSLQRTTRVAIVRAHESIDDVERLRGRRLLHGEEDEDWGRLFHGYHGIDAAFLYAWQWSELVYRHGRRLRDVTFVDGTGRALYVVGRHFLEGADHPSLVPGPEPLALAGDGVRPAADA